MSKLKQIFSNIYYYIQWIVAFFGLYVAGFLIQELFLAILGITSLSYWELSDYLRLSGFFILYILVVFILVKGMVSAHKRHNNETLTKLQMVYWIVFQIVAFSIGTYYISLLVT